MKEDLTKLTISAKDYIFVSPDYKKRKSTDTTITEVILRKSNKTPEEIKVEVAKAMGSGKSV